MVKLVSTKFKTKIWKKIFKIMKHGMQLMNSETKLKNYLVSNSETNKCLHWDIADYLNVLKFLLNKI